MSQARFQDLLSALHERGLTPEERRDLDRLTGEDARLARAAAVDLWVDRLLVHAFRRPEPRRRWSAGWLSTAAAALLLGTVLWVVLSSAPDPRGSGSAAIEKRAYVYRRHGKEEGRGTLTTRREGGALFLDDLHEDLGTSSRFLSVKEECSAELPLRPREISVEGWRADKPGRKALSALVKNGKADVIAERDRVVDLTPSTVTVGALLRLVALLPPREGASISLDILEEDMDLRKGRTLLCLGEHEVEVGGERVRAWKWDLGEALGVELAGTFEPRHFWVKEGRLLKIESPAIGKVIEFQD